MIPGARLVLLGRQGAGKGTQCVRLSRHYVVPHISTGDILRAAVREGTEFGRKAKAIMDSGDLVPDDIMVGIVDERLARDDTRSRGFILDGFPRTVAQAVALMDITQPRGIDLVVNLEVPREVVLARLAARRTCTDCGTNYSAERPPRYGATCDVCGGDVIQREDDTEEAINRRLDLYDKETSPLVAWFEERGMLREVDGHGDPDVVTTRLTETIDAVREGSRLTVRRDAHELDKMRKAGKVVAEMHARIRDAVKPGVSTLDLDRVGREVIDRNGARSNFLGYHGFPAVICTSPNSMIVHGIPSATCILDEGDIISIDCGAIIQGYHGDAAFTMGVGTISDEAEKLLRVTEESLMAGIQQMIEGNRISDIGHAVQTVAEGAGFSVVREYVGHAIGTAMHEKPEVPNYGDPGRGPKLRVGNVFAVEPMVNVGSPETRLLADGWSVVTADGKLSAHFEHTIAITDDGPEIFTLP